MVFVFQQHICHAVSFYLACLLLQLTLALEPATSDTYSHGIGHLQDGFLAIQVFPVHQSYLGSSLKSQLTRCLDIQVCQYGVTRNVEFHYLSSLSSSILSLQGVLQYSQHIGCWIGFNLLRMCAFPLSVILWPVWHIKVDKKHQYSSCPCHRVSVASLRIQTGRVALLVSWVDGHWVVTSDWVVRSVPGCGG